MNDISNVELEPLPSAEDMKYKMWLHYQAFMQKRIEESKRTPKQINKILKQIERLKPLK